MRAISRSPIRRALLAGLAGAGAFSLVLLATPSYAQAADAGPSVISQLPAQTRPDDAIHSFRISVPEAALVDLRQRLAAARWPDRETVTDRSQGAQPETALTNDEMLDDISLYWLTNTGTSAARLYWENKANNFNAVNVSIPAAITVFPGEIYRAPRSWAERSYHELICFHEVDTGGHFGAWEEPELLAAELRAAFRSLR